MDIANQIIQGPARRKKKRRYALFLIAREGVGSRDAKALDRAFESASKDVAVIKLHEPEEGLKVMMLKNIDFIVIDNSLFQDDRTNVEFALELKKRRKVPVLFVTKDERKLIAAYKDQLSLFEELDDYVASPVEEADFARRFRRMLAGNGRAAKRFDARAAIQIERLIDGNRCSGTLLDISLVGMGLKVQDSNIVRGEQLRVIVQLKDFEYFHPQFGDLLKLAVRVRRVSLDGETFGCSVEHVTPQQSECLAVVLERLNRRLRSKMLQSRAQAV